MLFFFGLDCLVPSPGHQDHTQLKNHFLNSAPRFHQPCISNLSRVGLSSSLEVRTCQGPGPLGIAQQSALVPVTFHVQVGEADGSSFLHRIEPELKKTSGLLWFRDGKFLEQWGAALPPAPRQTDPRNHSTWGIVLGSLAWAPSSSA